jgi:hypothetical protein
MARVTRTLLSRRHVQDPLLCFDLRKYTSILCKALSLGGQLLLHLLQLPHQHVDLKRALAPRLVASHSAASHITHHNPPCHLAGHQRCSAVSAPICNRSCIGHGVTTCGVCNLCEACMSAFLTVALTLLDGRWGCPRTCVPRVGGVAQ